MSLRWERDHPRQQWALIDDSDGEPRAVGGIGYEQIAAVPPDCWDDRLVPLTLPPGGIADAPSPLMPVKEIPGFQSAVKAKYGIPLPDEARRR